MLLMDNFFDLWQNVTYNNQQSLKYWFILMTQRAMSRSSLTTLRALSELSLSIIHFVNLLKKINHLVNFRSVNKLTNSIVNRGCYNKRKVLSCPSVPPLTAHVSNLSPAQCVYSQMSICLDCLILVLTFVIYRTLLYLFFVDFGVQQHKQVLCFITAILFICRDPTVLGEISFLVYIRVRIGEGKYDEATRNDPQKYHI